MKSLRYFKEKILLCILLTVWILLLSYFRIPCPILAITKIPCPGCGMTKAMLAAIRLDLQTAFTMHPMFWSIPLLLLLFLKDGRLFTHRTLNRLLLLLLGVGFLLQWIIRLFA